MNSLGEAILLVSRGNRHVNVFSDTNTVPGLGTLYDLDSYHDLAFLYTVLSCPLTIFYIIFARLDGSALCRLDQPLSIDLREF